MKRTTWHSIIEAVLLIAVVITAAGVFTNSPEDLPHQADQISLSEALTGFEQDQRGTRLYEERDETGDPGLLIEYWPDLRECDDCDAFVCVQESDCQRLNVPPPERIS